MEKGRSAKQFGFFYDKFSKYEGKISKDDKRGKNRIRRKDTVNVERDVRRG